MMTKQQFRKHLEKQRQLERCADRIANRWFGVSGIPNMIKGLQVLALEEIKELVKELEQPRLTRTKGLGEDPMFTK